MTTPIDACSLGYWANVAQVIQAVLAFLAIAPIVWAAAKYRQTTADQRKAKHYQAWQAISDAQGKPGSGGRRTALEELHRDHERIAGVNLSGGADLVGLSLPGADLEGADLAGAKLRGANLQETDLDNANLEGAILGDMDLAATAIVLGRAKQVGLGPLRGMPMNVPYSPSEWVANLRGASLVHATLRGARLFLVDLRRARLYKADLRGANLVHADLRGADLREADFDQVVLEKALLAKANLSNCVNLTRKQVLSTADWRGAELPEGLKDLELPEDFPAEAMDRLGRKSTSEWELDLDQYLKSHRQ